MPPETSPPTGLCACSERFFSSVGGAGVIYRQTHRCPRERRRSMRLLAPFRRQAQLRRALAPTTRPIDAGADDHDQSIAAPRTSRGGPIADRSEFLARADLGRSVL